MKIQLVDDFGVRLSPIDKIILHCSALPLARCLEVWQKLGVSPHYVIDENGETYQLVRDEDKAYHAGRGFWQGFEGDMNEGSLGIELINMSLGQEDGSYGQKQIDTLILLLQDLVKKHHLNPHHILGHSDIAPMRKADPGRAFPWEKLAQEGLGLPMGAEGVMAEEKNVASLLQKIGYDVHDKETEIASAYAFRRHFLPQEVAVYEVTKEFLDQVYPPHDLDLLQGVDFLKKLSEVAQAQEW